MSRKISSPCIMRSGIGHFILFLLRLGGPTIVQLSPSIRRTFVNRLLQFFILPLLFLFFSVSSAFAQIISTGEYFSVARCASCDNAWSWGANWEGELGDSTTNDRWTAGLVHNLSGIETVSAGGYFTLALKSDGTIWGWGANWDGYLGDGTYIDRWTPVQTTGLTNMVAISAGAYHALALKSDGTVWAWGWNGSGQLGDSTRATRTTPVLVKGLTNIIAISAGYDHSLALKSDGTLWAWGDNGNGQLGDSSTIDRITPVQIPALSGITSISAGYYFSLAIKSDYTVWAWGANWYGMLGDGTNTQRLRPGKVSLLTGVTFIEAGQYHALAIKNDSTVWAWGYNGYGQIGDNTTIQRSLPVKVLGLTGITNVSAGGYHSLAMKNDDSVWGWGYNYEGQLGDGTTTLRYAPVKNIALCPKQMVDIEIPLQNSCPKYDTLPAGGSDSKLYSIYNHGCDTLTISSVISSSSDFTVVSFPSFVPPLQSAQMAIAFTPGTTGSKTTTVTVFNNDIDTSFCLQGVSVPPPAIVIDPASFNISLACGDSLTDSLLIINKGNSNLYSTIYGNESYDSTSFKNINFSDEAISHVFTGLDHISDTLNISITLNGDYNSSSEYTELYIDGTYLGIVPDTNLTNVDVTKNYQFYGAQVENWLIDGKLTIVLDNNSGVGSGGYQRVSVDYNFAFPSWLSVAPVENTTQVSDTSIVIIKLTSSGLISDIYQTSIFVNTNDPNNPYITIPVTMNVIGNPAIVSSRSCFHFGSIMEHTTKKDSLYIKNTGCDTLKVTGITRKTSAFILHATTFNILPDDSAKLIVTFAPTTTGTFIDTLIINNNDVIKTVCLSGTGTPAPTIGVSPASFDINLTNCNDSVNQTLTISNTGGANLNYTLSPKITGLGPLFKFGYICNSNSNNVSVINTKTNAILSTIAVGSFPWRVAVRPDGKFVYVCNKNSNTVSVINTSTNTVTATIAIGGNPGGIAITFDSKFAYVGDHTNNSIKKINLNTNTVVATISNTNLDDPQEISLSPDGSRAFVCTQTTGITVINISTDAVTGNIPGNNGAHSIVFTLDGSKAYISEVFSNRIRVINTSTLATIAFITGFDNPHGLDISPDGNFIYVLDKYNQRVKKINVSTNTVVKELEDARFYNGWDLIITNNGKYAYVSNPSPSNSNHDVMIVDLTDLTIVNNLSTGSGTRGMAILKTFYGPFVNTTPASGILAASDSINITVEFNALGLNSGTYIADLNILSNDPINPNIAVPCTMNVIGGPKIELSQACLHFGSIMEHTTYTQFLFIKNTGCDTLKVSDLVKKTSTFTLQSNAYTIPPGDSAKLFVTFAPSSTGSFSDTLTIINNATTKTVCLSGTGTPAPVIKVNPESLEVTIANCNDSLNRTLNISNRGGSGLNYILTPGRANFGPLFKFGYVCNSSSNNVSVINTKTNTIVSTIGVGSFPWRVAVRPDGKFAYVCNKNSNNVSVINTSTNTITATIALGGNPGGIAITLDSRFAYVGDHTNNNIKKIDLNTNAVIATISNANLDDPQEISLSPDGSRAFVCTQSTGITVIDISTDAVTGNISGNNGAHSIVFTHDGSKAYVSEVFSNRVRVINTSTLATITFINGFDNPHGLDISSDGNFIYVLDKYNQKVKKINVSTNTVIQELLDPRFYNGWDLIIANNGKYAYVTNPFPSDANDDVVTVDLINFTVVNTFNTGSGSRGLATLKNLYGSFINTAPSGGTLGSSDSLNITVEFNALGLNTGTYTANLEIASNDPINPNIAVPCTMNIIGSPQIGLSETCLNFDSIMEYNSSNKSFYIYNRGCDTLFVQDISSSVPEFSLNDTAAYIIPGDSLSMLVKFAPASAGNFSGIISIQNDDTDTSICITGKSYPRPIQTHSPDTFSITLSCAETLVDTLTILNTGMSDLIFNFFSPSTSGLSATFDGNSDYMALPDNMIRNSLVLTVETWFRTTSHGVILAYQDQPQPTNPSNWTPVLYVGTDGKLRGEFWNGSVNPITSARTVNDGQWHHVALVGNTNTQSLYLDGNLAGTLSGSMNHLSMNYNQIGIGRTSSWPSGGITRHSFNGLIDEIRIYYAALTKEEINASRIRELHSTDVTLKGYWNFNDGSSNDLSSYNNNGTFQDNVTTTAPNAPVMPSWLSYTSKTDTLVSNASGKTAVEFTSSGLMVGSYHSHIVINSNDPLKSPDSVMVKLKVVGSPSMIISDTSIVFDTIMEFTSTTETINITNTGCDTLFFVAQSSINFFIDSMNINTAEEYILPGDTSYLTVFFNPDSAGTFNGALAITSNDFDSVIYLKGVAYPRPIVSYTPDSFNITLSCADSITVPLKVYNKGGSDLYYSASGFNNSPAPACNVITTGSCCDMGIYNVTLNTINNTSSNGTAGYQNFTSISTRLIPEQTYAISIQTGSSYSENVRAWIDWNNNGSFEGAELVLSSSNVLPNKIHTRNITVPKNVVQNTALRMRIGSEYGQYAPPQPCNNVQYGQFEDYTIYVGGWLSISSTADTVAIGDSSIINLKFNSSELIIGQYSTNIIIFSNDPLNNPDTIPVRLNTIGTAKMVISDTCVVFDTIMEFTSTSETFNITNTGCDTLFVTAQTSINFFIDAIGIDAAEGYILPGDTTYLTVFFNPDSAGNFSGTITLNNNGTDSVIALKGFAYPRPVTSYTPDSFNITLSCSDSITVPLVVYNKGGSDLYYSASGLSNTIAPSCNVVTTGHCCDMGIHHVTFNSINHSSSNGSAGYQNFTSISTIVIPGKNYAITVKTGSSYSENVRAWIDWNNNGSFEGAEQVLSSSNVLPDRIHTANITVPTNVVQSTALRMRIGSEYGQYAPPQPCNNVQYGQFEDYTIYVGGWLSLSSTTDTVVVGDSSIINLKFNSSELIVGQYSSNIIIFSNDPLNNPDTIPVSLNTVGAAKMIISDTCVVFDTTMEYTSSSETVYIANTGCDTLVVSAQASQYFNYDSIRGDYTAGYILPGDTASIKVYFNPDSAGNFTGTLAIHSNDYDTVVYLKGYASPRPIISYAPDTINITLTCSDTLIDSLSIYNSGLTKLIFSTGVFGKSALFDGNGDDITTLLNIDQSAASPGLTMEAWVYPTSNSSGRHHVISTDNGGYDWSLLREGGIWYVFTGESSRSTGLSVDLNQWQHIAAAFIPGTGIKFYKNGQEVTIPFIAFDNSDNNIRIGGNPGFTSETFTGNIDESRIWNYPRNQSEIIASMSKKVPGNKNELLGYWNFDQGTANDASNKNNHGTFRGNAVPVTPNAPIISADSPWLNYALLSDTIAASDSLKIPFTISSTDLVIGQYNSFIVLNSNDPLSTLDTVPVILQVAGIPIMITSDTCIAYDSIMELTTSIDSLMITNTGCDTLIISALTSPDFYIDAMFVNAVEYSLLPGDTTWIGIIFAPDSAGNFNGILTLNTNTFDTEICLNGVAYPRPVISVSLDTIHATITICQDSVYAPITIYNTGGSDLKWDAPAISANVILNPSVDTIFAGDSTVVNVLLRENNLSPGKYTYNLSINSNDPLNDKEMVVVILSIDSLPPIAPVVSDTAICFGNPTPDLIAFGDSIRWYDDVALSNMVHSGETFTTGKTATGIYVYYVTKTELFTGCQSQPDTVVLEINEAPFQPAGTDTSVCSDNTIPVLSATGADLFWYDDAALTNLVFSGTPFNTGKTTPGIYTYFVVDSIKGCPPSEPDTAILTIREVPTVNAGLNDTICEGNTYTLNGTMGGSATTITWTTSGDGNFDNDNLLNALYSPGVNDISNGSVTLTITTNNPEGPCNAISDSLILIVNSTPNAPNAAGITVCSNSAIPNLSSEGTNIRWYSDQALTTLVGTGKTYNTGKTSPGSYTYYVTDSINACPESSPTTVTLAINQSATANAGLNTTICQGSLYKLSGIVGGSALSSLWTTSGDGSFDDANSLNATYTPGVADDSIGSVKLTLTTNDPDAAGPCPAAISDMVLTINRVATVNAGPDNNICEKDNYILSGTKGGTATSITWKTSGTGSFNNPNSLTSTYTPSASDIASGTITLTITTNDPAGPCPAAIDSMLLTIDPAPIADAGKDTIICSGNNYTLNGTVGGSASTITWTSSGDGSFDDENLLSSIYTPGANDISNGTVTLTITTDDPAGSCEAASDSIILKINTTPAAPNAANTTVCSNSVIPDLSATGSNVHWYSDSALVNLISTGNTFNTGKTSPGSYTYYVIDSTAACPASNATSVTLAINESATADAGINDTICQGGAYKLSGIIGGSALSSLWTSSGDGTFNDESLLDPIYTPGVADDSIGSVKLTLTTNDPDGAGPCPAAISDMVLKINPVATVSAGPDNNICENDDYTLSGTKGGTATNITWKTSGTGSFNNPNLLTSTYTPSASDIASGAVTITITTNDPAGPCPAAIDSMLLTINPAPFADAGKDTIICSGNSYTLNGTIGGSASSIIWTSSGDGSFDDENLLSSIYTPGANDISNGTVTLTITTDDPAGSCEAASDSIILKINTTPAAPTAANTTVCSNSVIPALSATGGNVYWYSDSTLISLIKTGNSFNTGKTSPGSYTYYVIDSAAACPASNATSVTLFINESATADAGLNDTICEGEAYILNGTMGGSASSVFWTTSGGGTFDDETLLNPTYTPGTTDISIGETRLTISTNDPVGAGCDAAVSDMTLIINSAPIVSAGSDDNTCEGTNYTLSGSMDGGASKITWTTKGTGSFNNANLPVATYTPSSIDIAAGAVTLIISANGPASCPIVKDSMALTINTGATANAGTDTVICSGNNYRLNGAMGGSASAVFWKSSGDGTFDDDSLLNAIYTPGPNDISNGKTTLTITTNDPAGICSAGSDNMQLKINISPAPPAADDTTVCSNDIIPNLISSGTNIQWYSDAGLTNLVYKGNSYNTGKTSPGLYTYYITDSISACPASNAVSVKLTINAIPDAPTTSDETACFGDLIPDLTGSGTNLKWYSDSGLTSLVNTGNSYTTGNSNAGKYKYYITDSANGCPSLITPVTLTIHSKPSAPLVNDTMICSGNTADIVAKGSNIKWYSDSSLTTLLGTGNIYSTGKTNIGTYTYYVSQTVNGCEGYWDTLNLTIGMSAEAPISNNASVCFGQPVPALTATGNNLLWYNTPDLTTIIGSGSNYLSNETEPGIYTYYVTDSLGGCSRSSATTVVLTINPAPSTPIAADTNFCYGQTPILTALGTTAIRWYRDPLLTDIIFEGNTYTANHKNVGIYNYYITAYVDNCPESASDTVTFAINPNPLVTLNTYSATIAPGDSIKLMAYNASAYSWSPANTLNTNTGSTVIASPVINTTYTVTGTNASGCSNSAQTTINVTPTGIAENDFTQAVSVYPNPAREEFSVMISSNYIGKIQIIIFNLLGEELISKQIEKSSSDLIKTVFNAGAFPQGIYNIRIVTPLAEMNTKLVVN